MYKQDNQRHLVFSIGLDPWCVGMKYKQQNMINIACENCEGGSQGRRLKDCVLIFVIPYSYSVVKHIKENSFSYKMWYINIFKTQLLRFQKLCMIFGVFFILYFTKLSAGRGFRSVKSCNFKFMMMPSNVV